MNYVTNTLWFYFLKYSLVTWRSHTMCWQKISNIFFILDCNSQFLSSIHGLFIILVFLHYIQINNLSCFFWSYICVYFYIYNLFIYINLNMIMNWRRPIQKLFKARNFRFQIDQFIIQIYIYICKNITIFLYIWETFFHITLG